MGIDLRDLKWRARDAVRAACPNALFMTFVYLLLTAGLGGAVSWFAADPLGDVLRLYWQGVTLDRAIPLMLLGVGRLGLFLTILMTIWKLVAAFGYKRWCLRTARGEQGEVSDLMAGVSMVGRILWLRVLVLMYGFLWYVALFMPAGFVLALGARMWVWAPGMGVPVSIGVILLTLGLWFSRVLRYSMAVYCLADEPELGASWALRRSRRMMEGRVKDYVLLLLSFVGWFLLGGLIVTAVESVLVLVLGGLNQLVNPQAAQAIGSSVLISVLPALASWPLSLWLKPYVTITECNFYEKIKGGEDCVSG